MRDFSFNIGLPAFSKLHIIRFLKKVGALKIGHIHSINLIFTVKYGQTFNHEKHPPIISVFLFVIEL